MWFHKFNLSDTEHARAEKLNLRKSDAEGEAKGKIMPGVHHIFRFFIERDFKIASHRLSTIAY
jgi:hypothetical protein